MGTERAHVFVLLIVGLIAGWYASGTPVSLGNLSVPDISGIVGSGAECGTTYRVRKGDTLRSIALKAYGKPDYKPIFEANRRVLRSAARIEVGDKLVLPCLDSESPADVASIGGLAARAGVPPEGAMPSRPRQAAVPDGKRGISAAREAPISAALVMPEIPEGFRRVTFVTGSDFAPFVHADLPESGMTAEMVRLAMNAAAPKQDFGIAMVTDWSQHMKMLSGGSFDLGFPWFRPDCERVARLTPTMRRRCADFEFSEPLFEVPVGYYVLDGDPLARATTHDRPRGRRICRPANHFTFDLEQQGLMAPKTAVIFPPSPADCFRLLERGDVDVVSVSRQLAGQPLTRLGLIGKVVEARGLETRQSLHVIVPKSHPQGQALLGVVNAGLDDLKKSGRWFEVVSRHLGEYGMSIR